MATVNCLVDILQSIFFCVQQMIETQTGLKQVEGKYGCTVPLTVLNADLSVLKNTHTHTKNTCSLDKRALKEKHSCLTLKLHQRFTLRSAF